jgi:phage tail sheath protein FI
MGPKIAQPDVYIEETEPAAPIEGVSTSIAAFIGIAERGPSGVPTLITSIDAFTEKFGGPLLASTPYYLPLAVEGFFRNGGTTAYITRVSTATAANATLTARTGGATLATVESVHDGAAGEGGKVAVTDSSLLGTALNAAGAGTALKAHKAETTVTTIDVTRRRLTVASSNEFEAGDLVTLSQGATTSPRMTIASTAPETIELTAAAPAAPPAGEWAELTTADLATGDRRIRVDVPGTLSLRALTPVGSVITVSEGGNMHWGIAGDVGADSITLTTPLTGTFAVGSTTIATAEFDLAITDPAGVVRTYTGLSTTPTHPSWWGTAVDDPYSRVSVDLDIVPAGDPRPGAGQQDITGATNDDPVQAWNNVRLEINTHLKALEPIDEVSLVAAPGLTDVNAQQAIVDHCEKMFDRFAILDAPKAYDIPKVLTHRDSVTGTLDKGFAALYYPWITARDPSRQQVVPQPPSGHVAGIFAKTDQTRGVHKAPANVGIAGAVGLEWRMSNIDQGLINLKGVNALRILPGRGQPVVFGARTTANNRNWQYINIRRLFLFIEESIQESLTGSLFEPNDLALWQKLKRTLNEFLTRVWRDGALFGADAKDAFFVRIDEALNPPSTRKLGRLYIEIGIQPVYPAEFIIVRIGIWDGGAEVAES